MTFYTQHMRQCAHRNNGISSSVSSQSILSILTILLVVTLSLVLITFILRIKA